MEPRFKLSLSRMFQASFASCRSRNLSDIIHNAVFDPPIHDASFRKIRPQSEPTTESTVASSRDLNFDFDLDFLLPKRKISHRRIPLAPFPSAISGGRTCPPASPISPPKPFSEFAEKATNTKKTKKKKKKTTTPKQRKESPSSSVESNFGGTWWYSSEDEDEDEDETDTLFSSKSRSSDSSASHRRSKSRRRRSGGARQSTGMGVLPLKGRGKVKDSFAVVKKSRDPYNDFRSSMLEMIVEKQIFSVNDLEQLLHCFLSLNSHHHHRVILEVFTEIWEALFSDWWGS